MSFSEKQEFSSVEKAEYRSPVKGEETDGRKVGGDTSQNADKTSENKEKNEKEKKDPEIRVASIEEMKMQNALIKTQISDAIKNNPDWPPKSENPESARAEAVALEKSLNAFA